jgi:4-hydroxybutyryl-CoA dehydratase / vinylacetyl-CoA-Delta-isomerase
VKTGNQYRESLKDGRATYIDGQRVEDPSSHPLFKTTVDNVAESYDNYFSTEADASHPLYMVPQTAADLDRRHEVLTDSGMIAHITSTVLLAMVSAAPQLGELNPEYRKRMFDYIDYCRKNDLRCAETITDAKGDRKLRPGAQDDPDFYVHVVDRNEKGIFVTGAKLHITGASVVHELVVLPTKAMRPGEEQYAVAFAVPVNTPGVTVVNVTYAPRSEEQRHYPISGPHNMAEGFVVFDNVFVPNERVFLDGETSHAAVLAHSLGLWERAGVMHAAEGADRMVGLAALLAEANGIASQTHIRDRLSTMALYATMVRAGGEASIANATTNADGSISPSPLFVSATKYYMAELNAQVTDILHDIAGTMTVDCPTIADLENEVVGPLLEEALGTPDGSMSAAQRMRLFHYLRDLTADAYGGWSAVTRSLAGGGQYAQRLVTLKHYDLENAKQLARESVGIADGATTAAAPVGLGN